MAARWREENSLKCARALDGGCSEGVQTESGWGCRRGWVTGAVGGWNSVHITMQTARLTKEAPSVPVSHYKSGVTQSSEDNRPPHLIKRRRLLLRVKAAIDFTLTHSLVRERSAAKAGSRLPRLIHPPSHKVSFVYSRLTEKKKDTIKHREIQFSVLSSKPLNHKINF